MNTMRMNEKSIDVALDAFLHGARDGDAEQGRKLHEMFDSILSGRELPEGRLWLTDHARMMLAGMHRQLSHCEGSGEQLRESVLDAVNLKPAKGHWRDNCAFVRDLQVALGVANELCGQRDAGEEPDVGRAARAVANRGEFGLPANRICEVYDEISAAVGGFKEISAS